MTPDLFQALRGRQTASRGEIERLLARESVSGTPAFVGSVFANPAVPAATGTFFSVHPVSISGTEGEGNAGALVVNSRATVLVYVVGSSAPAAGDLLVCRFVANRWVAERGTSKTVVNIGDCPCKDLPTTLRVASTDHTSYLGIYQDCTLVYGPLAAVDGGRYANLGLGDPCFLSKETFIDQATGIPMRYYFACYVGDYYLGRVYRSQPYPPYDPNTLPYRDIFRYRWSVGFHGNSCSPVLLASGSIMPGNGAISRMVTISE